MARYEFPASYAQRRMWLLDQLDPGRPTYNVPWAIWLDGPLDEAALDRAWAAAVDRHEALRTVFRDNGGLPVQVVEDEVGPVELARRSLAELPAADREEQARALLAEHARAPFDLARGPLVRTCLIELAPDRHVLSLVAHHIVADGWSFRLLFTELAADYRAFTEGTGSAEGTAAATEDPEIQYADYTLWQLEHDETGGFAADERFWRTELAGVPPELALPTDHLYPAREGFAAAELPLELAGETAAALRKQAAERGSTLFVQLVAGYAALLSRLTGATDLLIGVPVAGRSRAETERVVGLFVNTLAVRADLRGDPTLAELADRLHAATARALAHQDLPFARVVELTRPDRRQDRAPLVQALCSVEERWPELTEAGLRWRPELVGNDTGKFELELTVTEGPHALAGGLRYRTDLFEPATAGLLVAGLRSLLDTLASAPDTRLSAVDILPPDVRQLVTRDWPVAEAPTTPYADGLLGMLLPACTGDRTVIRAGDATYTGDQLRAQAGRIAAGLVGLGVRTQDTIGILLPRGARVLPALLGAWWAGAAYLPLDPTHPPRRLASMLADAGVRVLITDRSELAGLLTELDSLATTPQSLLDLAAPRPDDPVEPAVVPAEPIGPVQAPAGFIGPVQAPAAAVAYLLYTSGSTGKPKAVTVTHGALAALLRAFTAIVPLGPADIVASATTFAFDIAILELLLPLLTGASVTVADAEQARDGGLLRRWLAESGATLLQGTPATWRLLTDAGGVPATVGKRLTGGDALPRDLADELVAGPDVRLWNLYGPSETTVYCAGAPVEPGPLHVGRAIAGSTMYVLDRWLNPVAPGVPGEIYIGGDAVGRGYAGAPGLTAERYLPDPFGDRPGSRLYRSGDLGRWLPGGRLQILGRVDRQLKIRGYRVETGEVEAVLRGQPGVRDAVVTAVAGAGPADLRLVAYLTTDDADPDVAQLREQLRQLLPEYMVPAAFVPLPEFPMTATGKVDHRALPAPQWAGAAGGDRVPPRTPLEAELAGLVAELLRLPEPAGALDNFFYLGGHSLTATQLMARILSRFGVELPVRTLFDDPTVAGLAAAIGKARPAG